MLSTSMTIAQMAGLVLLCGVTGFFGMLSALVLVALVAWGREDLVSPESPCADASRSPFKLRSDGKSAA